MLGVVVISDSRFPSLARFLYNNWVMGNTGEADLGLPSGMFKGFWCSGLSSCTIVPDTVGTAGWYSLLSSV